MLTGTLLNGRNVMTEVLFAVPVLPGKEELDRQVLDELAGSRREEYEASLREGGITRQAIWHQETPDGTLAIVYFEADDPEAPMRWTTSDSEVSRWFVEQMQEVHGIDISQQAPPSVSQVHDVRV
jgi:Family of unknown function (DUF6176)